MKKVLILLLLISKVVLGQDPWADFKRLNDGYGKFRNCSINFTYNLYKDHSKSKCIEIKKGILEKSGKKYYMSFLDKEIVYTGNVLIEVDNNLKKIKIQKGKIENDFTFFMKEIDKLKSKSDSIIKYKSGKEYKTYILTFKNSESEYDSIEINFYQKSNLIDRMRFYYREDMDIFENEQTMTIQPCLELVYSYPEKRTVKSKKDYKSQKYFYTKKGEYFAGESYLGYEVTEEDNKFTN